jgi:thiol-disulfide isomerase/thioredoxin
MMRPPRFLPLPTSEPSAQPPPAKNRFRFLGIAAAVVALAVAGGVYGIEHLRGNPADAACRAAVQTASRISPLVHGEVAALSLVQTPFRVPDLSFSNAQGRRRTLADWRGRTVLLNLWATWCVPCRREMPALDALQAQLGGPKFQVVAVNIDTQDAQKPLAFLKQIGVTRLAYYSDESAQVFEDLKVAGKAFGMPTTLLIDPKGCEIGDMAGPAEWASDDGVKLIRAAINDGSTVTR